MFRFSSYTNVFDDIVSNGGDVFLLENKDFVIVIPECSSVSLIKAMNNMIDIGVDNGDIKQVFTYGSLAVRITVEEGSNLGNIILLYAV